MPANRRYLPEIDLDAYRDQLIPILQKLAAAPEITQKTLNTILRQHPKDGSGFFRRDDLIRAYRQYAGTHDLPPFDPTLLERIRLKPTRTASGVTPVTVLTKPFPCPGECIFCPNDVRMPKSYLADEPGAQRAEQNAFDPYLQTYTRLRTYANTGHPTDKIELIILGGTWSFYPETYQIWFIKRVFDALNDFSRGLEYASQQADAVETALKTSSQLHPDNNTANVTVQGTDLSRSYNHLVQDIYRAEMARSREEADAIAAGIRPRTVLDEYATWEELEAVHRANETAACRCVGLVVETRPDHISVEEVLRVRRLGATKVQIGIQSLNDDVLRLNKRGHDVAATRRAVNLLRQAGFKIHAHWMPNLYGSDPAADVADYGRLFSDPDFCPDELKVYPCSLIESAELMRYYADGSWQPYTHEELLDVLTACFMQTPEYCRLTRVIRDIPSTDIVDGNQLTNFREIVEKRLAESGQRSPDIRAREIRRRKVAPDALYLDELWYASGIGEEVFLQYITPERDIAGFLRLSLPTAPPITPELADAAMIREVHIYGQSIGIGQSAPGRAQHTGLGSALIERAAAIAQERGYGRLAVISSVGTREYYRKRGFADGALYQVRTMNTSSDPTQKATG
jgi:elongator complex protein 3